VVEIDGKKMTFAEIAALPKEKKDVIVNNRAIMKPSKREAFDEFELQMVNQEADQSAIRKQVANQEADQSAIRKQVANQSIELAEKNAKRLETELQSSTDQIRSLSSLPKDIVSRAMEEAEKNPPKKLENIPKEKY
jgi:hypothetical protein